MCAQLRTKTPYDVLQSGPLVEEPLGIPPDQAQLALQTDACKEMVNKISWVLGSTYRVSYSNMKTPARAYAWRIVKQVIKDHGYPSKIAK